MQSYKVPVDIGNIFKTTDLLFYSGDYPATILFRLYENKYDVDSTKINFVRLLFFDDKNNVTTLSSSEMVEENNIKYIKITIPDELLNVRMDYTVRITVGFDNVNRQLKRFKIFSRLTRTSDLNTAIALTKQINHIYEEYLSSVKRQEIGIPFGLIPLDENARVDMKYMHDDIKDHIVLEYEGHGTRMNKDRELEYYDDQDEKWYVLNNLNGGDFNIPRKPSQYDYHGGTF